VVWGVFNNSNVRVETFPFPQKREAEEYAAKLKSEKGATFFVQPVKEPIADVRPTTEIDFQALAGKDGGAG